MFIYITATYAGSGFLSVLVPYTADIGCAGVLCCAGMVPSVIFSWN